MKTYIPLDRLKRSRDSGSALYNMHPTDVLGRAGVRLWVRQHFNPSRIYSNIDSIFLGVMTL